MNISTIPSGIDRVIIGYHRLDLGVPVVGEYVNNDKGDSRTFSLLVPGAKYRITAWGLGRGGDRRRSQSPAVREVTTIEKGELMYSDAVVSEAFRKWGGHTTLPDVVSKPKVFAREVK